MPCNFLLTYRELRTGRKRGGVQQPRRRRWQRSIRPGRRETAEKRGSLVRYHRKIVHSDNSGESHKCPDKQFATISEQLSKYLIVKTPVKSFYLWSRGEERGWPAERGAQGGPRGRGESAAVDVHPRVLLLPLGPPVLEPDFHLQIDDNNMISGR